MSFEYIKEHYGLIFHEGDRVKTIHGNGTVIGATCYIKVKVDGYDMVHNFHPTDLELISKEKIQ